MVGPSAGQQRQIPQPMCIEGAIQCDVAMQAIDEMHHQTAPFLTD